MMIITVGHFITDPSYKVKYHQTRWTFDFILKPSAVLDTEGYLQAKQVKTEIEDDLPCIFPLQVYQLLN